MRIKSNKSFYEIVNRRTKYFALFLFDSACKFVHFNTFNLINLESVQNLKNY